MSYPAADELVLPVQPYRVTGYRFGSRLRRRLIFHIAHLGDDVGTAGDSVRAIGHGEAVWSEVRPGRPGRPNWGGMVVIRHCRGGAQTEKHPAPRGQASTFFYSVYGHMKDLQVQAGQQVVTGQPLGVVAEGETPENGWWKVPHLHFAVYTGPWRDRVLPGYARWWDGRTRKKWWRDPRKFVERYNVERRGQTV